MDFEEAGRRLKLAMGLCVLGYGGWWLFLKPQMSSVERSIAEEQAARPQGLTAITPDGREVAVSERMQAANDMRRADPDGALRRMREIQAAPKDPDEKSIVEKWLPGVLLEAHRAAGDKRDWATQAARYAELAALPGDATRRRIVDSDRTRWLARALQEGDEASADVMAAALRADVESDDNDARRALSDWREGQVRKLKAALAAKDARAADAALAAASSWEPLDSGFAARLRDVLSGPELLARGRKALAAGDGGPAVLLLTAALADRAGADAARASLDDAYMALAGKPENAVSAREAQPAAVALYERVDGPRKAEALTRAAAVLEAWGDGLAASMPERASRAYEQALTKLRLAARIDARQAPTAAESRLAGKSADAELTAALERLDRDFEGALAALRPILREGKDPARRERALSALRDAWRKAGASKSFDRQVDISAFWIAEAGPPPFSDPFRLEFKEGLAAMADASRGEALNKQVFALSLLADAFPDDPEARDARREAARRGAQLARETANRGVRPKALARSPRAGRSYALVENGTSHHILMLFEGPETFFVRINPYRRGTVVFKDGSYLIGVATIKDEIVPYAVESSFDSEVFTQKFVVVTTGRFGPTQAAFGYSAYGHWTVLRSPDGEKPEIDPLSGFPR